MANTYESTRARLVSLAAHGAAILDDLGGTYDDYLPMLHAVATRTLRHALEKALLEPVGTQHRKVAEVGLGCLYQYAGGPNGMLTPRQLELRERVRAMVPEGTTLVEGLDVDIHGGRAAILVAQWKFREIFQYVTIVGSCVIELGVYS